MESYQTIKMILFIKDINCKIHSFIEELVLNKLRANL